jgi:hypothetical protein
MAPILLRFDVDTIVGCDLWADRQKPGIKSTYSYVDLDPQPHNPIFFLFFPWRRWPVRTDLNIIASNGDLHVRC